MFIEAKQKNKLPLVILPILIGTVLNATLVVRYIQYPGQNGPIYDAELVGIQIPNQPETIESEGPDWEAIQPLSFERTDISEGIPSIFDGELTRKYAVIGIENTDEEFIAAVENVAVRIRTEPSYLLATMSYETGGTFHPAIQNPLSGATGILQFIPQTARGLGTSTEELAQLSPVEQLVWVEKYFQPYVGRLNSLEDVYMAVLWPRAIGQSSDSVLFSSPSLEYRQNSGLDFNKDRVVTVGEATAAVRSRLLNPPAR